MSCPAGIMSLKDGKETGRVYHNWGWIPPSDQEIGLKVIKIVGKVPGPTFSGELGEWDKLVVSPFGTITKDKYHDMYDVLKAIHYGLYTEDFKISDYLE